MTARGRRDFLRRSARAAGVALVAPSLMGLVARSGGVLPEAPDAPDHRRAALGEGGYGPLHPAGPELALPEGFT